MTVSDVAGAEPEVDESSVIRRMIWRLVPVVFLCYVFAYLDRVNISFAALTMNADLEITATAYGWIAGIFFIGYFLFAVPANVVLAKVGARIWLSSLTVAFGVIGLLCAFVQDQMTLAVLRFLLGAAEAGVFPGIIVFLTLWFPARHRAKVLTAFIIAAPVSAALGGPLAGAILQLHDALGLAGWRWLFLVEGAPTVLLGLAMFGLLASGPRTARWLSAAERRWLVTELETEAQAVEGTAGSMSTWRALVHPRVMVLCVAQTCVVVAFYGFALWLPQLLARLTESTTAIGLLSALPFVLAVPTMILVARSSDRTGERSKHVAACYVLVAVGLLIAAVSGTSWWALVGLSLVAMGNFGAQPSFFALPPIFLTGARVAAAVAIISSVSNLGGFLGPYMIGALKDVTGGFTVPLLVLACLGLVGTVTILATTRWSRPDAATDTPTASSGDREGSTR